MSQSWISLHFCIWLQSARTAHPVVQFTCTNQEPMIIENLPFDKYEVEPCPLTQYILSRKQASTCWQVRQFHALIICAGKRV